MRKIYLLLFMLCMALYNYAQTTITLQPGATGQNAHIDNLHPGTNNGTYPLINAGYNTVGGTPALSHDFIRFDLSAIPAGATVVSAKLSLYHAAGYDHSVSTNNYEMLDMALSAWRYDSITWNNQPALSGTDTIQIGNTQTPQDSKPNIDITSFVQYWASNPAQNFGMAMLLVNEPGPIGNFQSYGSCFNADSTVWPKLVITYQVVCTGHTVLQPGATGQNAHIDNLHPGTNNGTYPLINAGYNTVGGTPTLSHDFIQFDLSSIPAGATVNSATLSLYSATGYTSSASTANYEMLDMALGAWQYDSITWNNQPALSATDTIQIGNTLTATDSKPNINLTSFAQYWVSHPAQNFGMAMLLVNEPGPIGNFQTYGSCFNADSTVWPKLVIDWQVCPTGINEVKDAAGAYSIYPNPTTDVLYIRSLTNQPVDLRIFDITGRKVAEAMQVNEISTAQLQAGVYLININNGKDTVTSKFVKN